MVKILALAFGALAAMNLATGAEADEGMWTFDNFPAATVKSTYGVTIDQAWLDHVRGAAVRLSVGCSASVVTGAGLVLTNHHCVRDCVQNLSTPQVDYTATGFSATKREDEKLCPGMQAEILTAIADVTKPVTEAAAGKSGEAFVKARDAAIAAAEAAGCTGREAKFRCQVVTLYHGGQYKLYTYRKYADVRLVFAPEAVTGSFGGDPDNFNFPRYDLDCSFLRLYENGAAVETPDHLTWTAEPPKTDQPVFVVGNPASTQRLLTAEQLETLRDTNLPRSLDLLSEVRGRLTRFGEESTERARISNALLSDIENSYKALHGREKALVDPALIAAKRKYDQDLQAKIAKDPKLAAEIGDPWSDVAKVQADIKRLSASYSFMESSVGGASQLYEYAVILVRGAAERIKPNGERLPAYTDSRLPLLEKELLDEEPIYPELEQVLLEFWLSKLREYLTADAPGTRIFLGMESPETLSARLATSKLSDPALRHKLWDGGSAAIQASDDPLIRYVLATDPTSRAIRKEYEERVTGPTDRASERLAKARFAIYGTAAYPDATLSLRISYGKVTGWTDNGMTVPPFTYFKGLWQRATGQAPFALAPRWVSAESKVKPDTVFDFVSNTDIIGGNSGSPIVDAEGQVLGAVFDGNIESLGGAFGFDQKVNRSVSVSTAAITEALSKIYGSQTLVADLTRK